METTTNVDFISTDGTDAISSSGKRFAVGDKVYHVLKPKEHFTIKSFEIDEVCNQVDVFFEENAYRFNIGFISHVNKDVIIEQARQNFISADKQQAIESFNHRFKVGDDVKHEGDHENLIKQIASFEIDVESNEVLATMADGSTGHIDFLYKPKTESLSTVIVHKGKQDPLINGIEEVGPELTPEEQQAFQDIMSTVRNSIDLSGVPLITGTPYDNTTPEMVDEWLSPKQEKAQFRFNSAEGALLCSKCFVIMKVANEFTEQELAASRGEAYLEPQYCNKCKSDVK